MALERVAAKCLAKDPARRYQHADEVAVDLRAIDLNSDSGSTITRATETPHRSRWKQLLPWSLVVLMTAVLLMLIWRVMQPATAPSVDRLNLNLPEEAPLALFGAYPEGLGLPALALSPDGTQLVYVAEHEDGTTRLYRRAMDRLEATPMPGTDGAYHPFFSPDGHSVGFFAEGRLKKVSLQGGQPVMLCEVSGPVGVTWMLDGRIVFADRDGNILSHVSDSGGEPERVVRSGDERSKVWWPSALPRGEEVLVSTYFGLAVVSLRTGRMKRLSVPSVTVGVSNPTYVPTGHVLFGVPGRLMAAPFDLDRLEVTGPPVPVVEEVRTEITYGAAQFAVSGNGKLAYVPGRNAAVGELVWVDRQGREEPLGFPPAHFGPFQLSADGRLLVVSVLSDTWDVWIYDLEHAPSTRRLTVGGSNLDAVWTPDGERVVFCSHRDGVWNVYWKRSDGKGEVERLTTSEYLQVPEAFAPDGRLIYAEVNDSTATDLWLLSLDDDRTAELLMATPFTEAFPKFSPAGRYLAYTSDESGQWEVYVQLDSEGNPREQVSIGGGMEAVWSSTGDALFYQHVEGRRWMVVPIETTPTFRARKARVFVEGPYLDLMGISHDVGADDRLLLVKGSGVRTANRLNVVVNWFEELKQRVPVNE